MITDDGQATRCAESEFIVIGGSTARVSLPGDSSSNEYAYIENRQGHPWLVPLIPTITAQINGKIITQASPLRDGDVVTVGEAAFSISTAPQLLTITTIDAQRSLPEVAASSAASAGRMRLFKLALYATFLLLVMVVLFVFFATPVSLVITPDPESTQFRGFPPPVRVKDRYLVLPGQYEVRASKNGYESLKVTVSVTRGDFQELSYALQKLPGRVSIYSQPADAVVTLDGRTIGLTPLVHSKIPAGRHEVIVSAPRYQAQQLDLNVEGLDREQIIRIDLAPDWAPVTVRSQPAGADIFIDGERLGVSPLTTELLSGKHVVSIELERHLPEKVEVEVEAGMALVLPAVALTPTPGRLRITSKPADATVTLDGTYQGSTPLDLTLTPDVDHAITLTKAGYVEKKRTVNMKAAAEETIMVDLQAEYGVIFIASDPVDATLYVDGEQRGSASQRLRLTTRPHTLEFRKPGYKTYRTTLTPRAGVSKELSVNLLPDSANVGSPAGSDRIRTAEGQELKLVTPGQFTMGASRREQGRRANENLRRIELTRHYYMGTKEVTNAEFRRFKPGHSSGAAYGRSLDLDNQPVVNVSWEDAVAYLNWLSKREGLPVVYQQRGDKWEAVSPLGPGYRLPTEAEWANAARFSGAEPRKYAWNGSYPPRESTENFGDQSAAGLLPYTLASYSDGFAVSAPVGSFAPNESGFYDLGGNVAEWMHDYYEIQPAQTNALAKDPVGLTSGRHHVIRGAGWKDSTISELRLSFRDYADGPRDDLGFRIARYAD